MLVRSALRLAVYEIQHIQGRKNALNDPKLNLKT